MSTGLTTVEALSQVGQWLQSKYENDAIPTAELKREAARLCQRKESSIIPSDFCYNRTNARIPTPHNPLFVYESRSRYKYVGSTYKYTVPMFHKPHGQVERAVGSWLKGVFTKNV